MNILNLLLSFAIYGLIGLFSLKAISAGFKVFKESKQTNRRFVDTLKFLSKQKNPEKLNIQTYTDEEGNTEVSFRMDKHLFKITLTSSRRLISCIGYHKEYDQQVLYFTYDNRTDTFVDKKISSQLIKNEAKDMKIINEFMKNFVKINWDEWIVPEKEKDYEIVKGSLFNIPQHSAQIEKSLKENQELGDLTELKREISHSNLDLKTPFLQLIETAIHISQKIESLDDRETKHHFQNIVERDISRTFYAYKKLDDESKTKYQSKFQKNIGFMQTTLNEILDSIQNEDVFEVEKTLRIVEERYKK